jgi:hypothetical protein
VIYVDVGLAGASSNLHCNEHLTGVSDRRLLLSEQVPALDYDSASAYMSLLVMTGLS